MNTYYLSQNGEHALCTYRHSYEYEYGCSALNHQLSLHGIVSSDYRCYRAVAVDTAACWARQADSAPSLFEHVRAGTRHTGVIGQSTTDRGYKMA